VFRPFVWLECRNGARCPSLQKHESQATRGAQMNFARPLAWSLLAAALAGGGALAQDAAGKHEEDGKWLTDDEDVPTYNVTEDGTVDWYTFSGYRRYHSDCHVCHGPDGQGSSYAPALAKSVEGMDYYQFLDIVTNGKQAGNLVMPSFGTNKNVMCYIDDIWTYLRSIGDGAIPRGRPAEHADKPASYKEAEDACMG
jgi:methanol metabolism-related c-type cytochrome